MINVCGWLCAGALAVLWLALRNADATYRLWLSKWRQENGFAVDHQVSYGAQGLALDIRGKSLALLQVEPDGVVSQRMPFDALASCELYRSGIRVRWALHADQRVREQIQDRLRTLLTPGRRSRWRDQYCIRLGFLAPQRTEFVLPVADGGEARRWFALCARILDELKRVAPAGKPSPASSAVARSVPADVPQGEQPAAQAAEATPPRPRRQALIVERRALPRRASRLTPEEDQWLLEELTLKLQEVLQVLLQERKSTTITERELRDATGLKLSIRRFHEGLNRLKRNKALPDFRLSYSRQSETWRISRTA